MRTISTSFEVLILSGAIGVLTDDLLDNSGINLKLQRPIDPWAKSEKLYPMLTRGKADHLTRRLDGYFCGCCSLVERCTPEARQHLADPLRAIIGRHAMPLPLLNPGVSRQSERYASLSTGRSWFDGRKVAAVADSVDRMSLGIGKNATSKFYDVSLSLIPMLWVVIQTTTSVKASSCSI